MKKNIKYVIATSHAENSAEFKNTAAYLFVRDFPGCDIDIHFNNREGLPSIYNKYIIEKYRDSYVIFLHDDVFIHDLYIEQKIRKGFEKYNIIGLAGCTKISKKSNPTAWHLMCDRENYIGEVTHTAGDDIWTTVFGRTSGRALLIDGLFIGVDIACAIDNKLNFDEDFKFHHYDLSFCLRANQSKLSVGIIQLFCIHQGLGDSMKSQEWVDSAVAFRKKYL